MLYLMQACTADTHLRAEAAVQIKQLIINLIMQLVVLYDALS